MQRFLRAVAPDVLFVSTALPMQMEAAVDQAIRILPNVQIVLVDSAAQPETLRRARRLGVQECLTIPFSTDDLHGVIERSLTRRANMPAGNAGTNCLYSFLPARGGVGSSFLAAQAALSLPVNAAHRGLLIDADLDGGMIQYLLKCPLPPWAANVENPQSLIEAMERVEQLDEHLWPRLVTGHGHLDVMQAGDSGGSYRPDPERLQDVLAFARRQYSVILVDLPAVINRLSAELILQSKAVFLVTTQEVASLHRARRRLRALEDLQPKDRVRLLVNRVDNKGGTPMDEVASIVGIPVDATFVNDYAAVQQAILAGSRLPVSRPLGRQLTDLAASLPADPVPVQPPRKLRFVEGGFALPH
jgi:pilus assembly protein CpaE